MSRLQGASVCQQYAAQRDSISLATGSRGTWLRERKGT